jgi:hypothetical protein
MKDFQLLSRQFGQKHGKPGDVAARMRQALRMPHSNRIGVARKDDGDGGGGSAGRLHKG